VARRLAAAEGPRVLWGAWIADPGHSAPYDYESEQNAGAIGLLEGRVHKKMSIVHFGQAWQGVDGRFNSFDAGPDSTGENRIARLIDRVRAHGSIALVDWASWQLQRGGQQATFALARVVAGAFDDYVRRWAREAAAYGYPFMVRFDPGMNGSWTPWGTRGGWNGNTPAEFVAAWRHVVDIVRAEGASNVTWVWCPNFITSRSQKPLLRDLYPGADYVDWTCAMGYNGAQDAGGERWVSFEDLFAPAYDAIQAFAAGKPFMIGEVATSKDGGSKPAWITAMLTDEIPRRFPNLRALVWFNWDGRNPKSDWPLEGNSFDLARGVPPDAPALAAFAAGIAAPYYASNTFGNLPARGKILPPGW
jgi:hypothetical protein